VRLAPVAYRNRVPFLKIVPVAGLDGSSNCRLPPVMVCVPVNVFALSVAAPLGNGRFVSPAPLPTKAGAVCVPEKMLAPSVATPLGGGRFVRPEPFPTKLPLNCGAVCVPVNVFAAKVATPFG